MIFKMFFLCLGLVFIVCMYYVTVIALSHHVSVVMCFVHIIIIIMILAVSTRAGGKGAPLRRLQWNQFFAFRIV